MKRINFEDGQLVNAGYVKEDGTIEEAVYEGNTPLSAFNLNKLQDNTEEAIADSTKTIIVNQKNLDLDDFLEDGRWYFSPTYTPLNIPTRIKWMLRSF